jgi:hypothetical protein
MPTTSPPIWRRLAALVLAVAQDATDLAVRPVARARDTAQAARLERSAHRDLELAGQARAGGAIAAAARLDAIAVAQLRRADQLR